MSAGVGEQTGTRLYSPCLSPFPLLLRSSSPLLDPLRLQSQPRQRKEKKSGGEGRGGGGRRAHRRTHKDKEKGGVHRALNIDTGRASAAKPPLAALRSRFLEGKPQSKAAGSLCSALPRLQTRSQTWKVQPHQVICLPDRPPRLRSRTPLCRPTRQRQLSSRLPLKLKIMPRVNRIRSHISCHRWTC
jgi:hypothetical protein